MARAAIPAKAANAVDGLCCMVNPTNINWCVYCHRGICFSCRDSYINPVDATTGYFHHEKCLDLCPHTPDYHKDEEPKETTNENDDDFTSF